MTSDLPGREHAALDEREPGPELHPLFADPADRDVRGAAAPLLEVQDDDELGRRQRLSVRVGRDAGKRHDERHLVARNAGLKLRLRVLPQHEDVVLGARGREHARQALAERHDAQEDRHDETDAEHGERRRDLPHEEVPDVVLQRDAEHRESFQPTCLRPSGMERWADRIAGTSPARRPTRTATTKPVATTSGKSLHAPGEAAHRRIEETLPEAGEGEDEEPDAEEAAEEGEQDALAEDQPEDRSLRESERPQDGDLRDPLAGRHRHRVRRDEEDDADDDGADGGHEQLDVAEHRDEAVLHLLLGLGPRGSVAVLEHRVDLLREPLDGLERRRP